ncbi:hypothetical protein C4D60_Mb04t11330 [Musa balbisiana]|uniref:Uncharacterized protein n=1 Tax=Musa balbisiana TaxID=52838 RepID=A0A4V4H9P3_MUSBA|nr:hypothetical protein C4D60_Mb04t11330 [Musa balbisiana]
MHADQFDAKHIMVFWSLFLLLGRIHSHRLSLCPLLCLYSSHLLLGVLRSVVVALLYGSPLERRALDFLHPLLEICKDSGIYDHLSLTLSHLYLRPLLPLPLRFHLSLPLPR